MHKLRLFSPAKLNLFFRVLRKRPDGFHEIASLCQAINLGDELTLSLNENKDCLTCSDPNLPTDSSNLVLRAASLFRQKTGIAYSFSFHLIKKIPVQAGLGGGSSNAATTLWGLNQLMQTKIESETLAKWGVELGSDVPFFFSKGRAYCEGKGEVFTQQPPVNAGAFWLAKPKESLPTPAVYRALNLDRLKEQNPIEALLSHSSMKPICFNDLESTAMQLLPGLKEIKNRILNLGFDQVHMTGSGTAFFCFGHLSDPKLPHIDFYPVQFHHREGESWYKFPH